MNSELHNEEAHLGVGIDVDGRTLAVERTDVRYVVVLSFALLFLELERDAADWALGDAAHQVGGEAGDLVAEALRRDDGDLVTDALVGVAATKRSVLS